MLREMQCSLERRLSALPVGGPCQQPSAAALGPAHAQHMQLSEHTCKFNVTSEYEQVCLAYLLNSATQSSCIAEHHNGVLSHFVMRLEQGPVPKPKAQMVTG